MKTKLAHLLALAAIVALMALAGCGGGDGGGHYGNGGSTGSEETAAATAAPNPEEGATFVSVAAVPGLGRVIVDSKGLTLYSFAADGDGASTCYGRCATTWPPLLSAGEPFASNGAQPALVGTAKRKDGATQVTYAGRPLYTYAADQAPGDASGDGLHSFGDAWRAMTPSGTAPGGS
jgi:predicted lipoprotein with Yx(FWY)xxD motif